MLFKFVIKCYITRINTHLQYINIVYPEGESMKICFDGSIKLEFHGSKVTSDGGFLAYCDQYERWAKRCGSFLQWPRHCRTVD